MNKAKILIMTLCFLGVLAFAVTPASAAIVVDYYWYTTGGTKAVGDETWVIGDISGDRVAVVEEEYYSTGYFQYTIKNLLTESDPYSRIMYFAIDNPYSVIATDWTEGDTNWFSWDFPPHTDFNPAEWTWQTTVFTSGADGGTKDNFRIYTTAPRGLVDATLQWYDSGGYLKHTYTGKVSAPVPEPTSLLLLGGGLLGVALLGVARRRKITV